MDGIDRPRLQGAGRPHLRRAIQGHWVVGSRGTGMAPARCDASGDPFRISTPKDPEKSGAPKGAARSSSRGVRAYRPFFDFAAQLTIEPACLRDTSPLAASWLA